MKHLWGKSIWRNKLLLLFFPNVAVFSYAVTDYFWWRLNIRFLSGWLFVSVWPVLYISTRMHVLTYFRVFFYERPPEICSQFLCCLIQCLSQIAIQSLSSCACNTQGFSSSHSYWCSNGNFIAPLFHYCIFSTTYFSSHSVWILWYGFFFCRSICIWGLLKKSYLISIIC